MKINRYVDQKECLRQGIDNAPKIKTLDVDVSGPSAQEREYVLNHLDDKLRFPIYALQPRHIPQPGICPPNHEGFIALVRARIAKDGANRTTCAA